MRYRFLTDRLTDSQEEVQPAMEQVDSDPRIPALQQYRSLIQEQGVDQSLAFALEELVPGFLPEVMPAETFTVAPSSVNQKATLELLEQTLATLAPKA